MRTLLFLSAILFITTPVLAKSGFYLGVDAGNTTVNGQDISYDDFIDEHGYGSVPRIFGGTLFSTDNDCGGLTSRLYLGYNLFGYGALELTLTGSGTNLSDSDLRAWAAQASTTLRIYPLWHWQEDLIKRYDLPNWLLDIEPSLSIGLGPAYQVYIPIYGVDEVAYSTNTSIKYGIALEYFFNSFFRFHIDYNYLSAPFDKFIFNWSDDEIWQLREGSGDTSYHQFLCGFSFHFNLAKE